MIPLTCPTCSVALKPKSELAGKNIRCPNCETLVRVPASELCSPSATDDEGVNPWPLRIGVAAAVVVALAVGLAGGFVYGHGRGVAERANEASEAKVAATNAEEKRRRAEEQLAVAVGEQARLQNELAAAVKQRNDLQLNPSHAEDWSFFVERFWYAAARRGL
ncbi:MAG TPA: hypothetical protein VHR66_31425 [Gemmataceae bacterium]|jgi:hypothetical protein|nr:hypothetical protein [Gemmataceae bacterium]